VLKVRVMVAIRVRIKDVSRVRNTREYKKKLGYEISGSHKE